MGLVGMLPGTVAASSQAGQLPWASVSHLQPGSWKSPWAAGCWACSEAGFFLDPVPSVLPYEGPMAHASSAQCFLLSEPLPWSLLAMRSYPALCQVPSQRRAGMVPGLKVTSGDQRVQNGIPHIAQGADCRGPSLHYPKFRGPDQKEEPRTSGEAGLA